MSPSPNPYSASIVVFTQATSTMNGQNVNEQKWLCHLLQIVIQPLWGCLQRRLVQGMDKMSMNKNACHLLQILIQLLKRCLHKQL
jgi:hypothetical protein